MQARSRRLLVALSFVVAAGLVYRHALTGQVYFGRDAMGFFQPNATFLHEALSRGEVPLWIPYVRLGQPFAATLSTQAFYPPHLLLLLAVGPVRLVTALQLFHALLAAAGTFAAARGLGARRLPALVAGIAFGFSPVLTELAGQQNVVAAAAWSGFIVLAADRVRRSRGLRWVAGLALFVAMSLLAGSPETTLWQGVVVAGVLGSRPVRGWGRAAGAAVWALGLAAVALVPAAEFLRLSSRGGRTDTLEWSTSWHQVLGMVWPFAEHPRGAYWGGPDQWFVLTVFVGTTVFVAAGFGATVRRVRGIAIAGILLLLLAAGRHSPLTAWLFSAPPLGWFRYPAKYLVGVSFVLALLASRGLPRVALLARRWRGRRIVGAAVVVACAGVLLGLGRWVLPLLPLRAGAQGGWLWVVAALALFVLVALFRRVDLLAACVMLELAAFHTLFVHGAWTDASTLRRPSELAARIPDPLRVRVSVSDLGGDDPFATSTALDPLHGNRFIEAHLHAIDGIWAPEQRAAEAFQLSGDRAAFDLAGVAYYVRRGAPPFADLEVVAESGATTLHGSATAMPRAFVVHRADGVDDATALRRVLELEQPARETAFLASGAPLAGPGCPGSSARITGETANTLTVGVNACAEGLLVVSDTWFPGWKATVDGTPTEVLRADLALRAVSVPRGEHTVHFRYAPRSVWLGALLSAAAWLALALAAGAGWRRRRRLTAPPARSLPGRHP